MMRKFISIIFFLALNTIFFGCVKNDELIQISSLKMRWIESHEENKSGETEIYRSGDLNDFPLSRYRQVFYFDDNNICEYSVLADNDAHFMATGSWKYNKRTKVLKIYNSDSQKIYEFEIIELTSQVLKLRAN